MHIWQHSKREARMRHCTNQRNPILPLDIHVPDSEAHVMSDGRLCIYGSYDARDDVYCSDRHHVVSTSDMLHWTVHEEALNSSQIPWVHDPNAPKYPGIDWSHPTPFIQKMLADMAAKGDDMKEKFEQEGQDKPALLFAPDCIEKDGKYYMYICLHDDSEGVVVADKPEGPFGNPVQLPCGGIDPAIFIDDDGQAYYYWGQLFSHGVKMNPDMVSFDREQIVDDLVTEEEHFFHEGSSMRKIGDTYYYVYADMERGKPTSLGYSTSSSPLGPFTYGGIIVDNDGCDPESWNNHGSIECVNGTWYVFYHRCSRNSRLYRRLCIEKLTILPDGTIPEVKMTSQGIGAPFGPGEAIMGYQACGLSGTVYIDVNEEADTKAAYPEKLVRISEKDRMVFRYVESEVDWSGIQIKATGSATLKVFLNEKEAGSVTIQNGKQLTGVLQAKAGMYEVVLQAETAEDFALLELTLW